MRKILLPLLLMGTALTLNLGCSPEKRAQHHLARAIALDPSILQSKHSDSTRIKDSVVLTEQVRYRDSVKLVTHDSVVIVPKTVISGDVKSPCDSAGKLKDFDYTFGAGANKVRIWADGGHLHFSSSVDSLVSTSHEREIDVSRLRDSIRSLREKKDTATVTNNNSVITRTVHRWGFFDWVGLATVIAIAIFVLTKVLRLSLPPWVKAVLRLVGLVK